MCYINVTFVSMGVLKGTIKAYGRRDGGTSLLSKLMLLVPFIFFLYMTLQFIKKDPTGQDVRDTRSR